LTNALPIQVVLVVTVVITAFHGVGGQTIFGQVVRTLRVVEPRAYLHKISVKEKVLTVMNCSKEISSPAPCAVCASLRAVT
jgi:hypothetical protein